MKSIEVIGLITVILTICSFIGGMFRLYIFKCNPHSKWGLHLKILFLPILYYLGIFFIKQKRIAFYQMHSIIPKLKLLKIKYPTYFDNFDSINISISHIIYYINNINKIQEEDIFLLTFYIENKNVVININNKKRLELSLFQEINHKIRINDIYLGYYLVKIIENRIINYNIIDYEGLAQLILHSKENLQSKSNILEILGGERLNKFYLYRGNEPIFDSYIVDEIKSNGKDNNTIKY